jgi:hypothetical protein
MKTRTSRIILPGINIKALKTMAAYVPIAYYVALSVVVLAWRSQVTACYKPVYVKDEVIQGTETQRYTAKMLGSPTISYLYAYNAIGETLYLELNLADLDDDEISRELKKMADTLVCAPEGAKKVGKVLKDSSLTEETKQIHRIGLMAQLRGLFQARSIFRSNELFVNISLATLTDTQLEKYINELIERLELPIPTFEQIIEQGGEALVQVDENDTLNLGKTAISTVKSIIEEEGVSFNDDIDLGNDTNTLPLETSIGVKRIKPSLLSKVETPIVHKNKISDFLYTQYGDKFKQQEIKQKPAAPPAASKKNKKGGK